MNNDTPARITYTIDVENLCKAITVYDKRLEGSKIKLCGVEYDNDTPGKTGLEAYIFTFLVLPKDQ